jgi:hypothetical protein
MSYDSMGMPSDWRPKQLKDLSHPDMTPSSSLYDVTEAEDGSLCAVMAIKTDDGRVLGALVMHVTPPTGKTFQMDLPRRDPVGIATFDIAAIRSRFLCWE